MSNDIRRLSELSELRRRSAESHLQEIEAESLSESLPEGFNADNKQPAERPFIPPALKANIAIALNIVHGSIWGVLARKGLIVLSSYNGSYLSGVVWANFGACIVMSMAVRSTRSWEYLTEFPNKGAIPLYTGLTTGFCGSFLSFSSVLLEAFTRSTDTVIGDSYHFPNPAYGIMEAMAVLLAQFGLSVAGFHIGKHVMEMLEPYTPRLSMKGYRIVELLSIVTGIATYIVVIVLVAVKKDGDWRSWTFSCLFAPFGALLRFYLSKFLNPKIKNFPLGTFAANLGGTLLLAILTLLGRGKRSLVSHMPLVLNITVCHVLQGLDDGFCGALTTVSTFVVELFGLKTDHAYKYGGVSILSGYVVMILILGSYNWTVGLTDPVCT